MYAKLAWRNVRRQARDYAIYFITVALGVAMFYAFNSIESQRVLFDALSSESTRILDLMNMLMKFFSGVVAFILGFLVVYANRFLIRRRRREFGTYLILGMTPSRVSRVMLYEIMLVGSVSLLVGLGLGIALSQGLSFATAALMGTTMTKYRFIVSSDAIALTVLCFAIIFVVAAIIDIIYIRRCRLVKLLSAHEANENMRQMRIPIRVAGFIASIAVIGCAYWQLSINGLMGVDVHFWLATALMIIGTLLFFWSIAGFTICLLTSAKGVYFKKIRMFTTRQIASKVNTAFVSISVVCIMLFFALSVSSIGMGLVEVLTGDLNQCTRFDATLSTISGFEEGDPMETEFDRYDANIAAYLADHSTTWASLVEGSAQLDYYSVDAKWESILNQLENIDELADDDVLEAMNDVSVKVIPVSQFNATRALLGDIAINLDDDEFAINNLASGYQELTDSICDDGVELSFSGKTLHISGNPYSSAMRTSSVVDVALEFIVPDSVVDDLKESEVPEYSYMNIMYKVDRAEGDKMLEAALDEALPALTGSATESGKYADYQYSWPVHTSFTATDIVDQAGGFKMLITFLALYIGFVLIVATAAILAIQQLSETADSLGRYRRLSELGCDTNDILASQRTQTILYFLAPLFLAACHSICADVVISNTMFESLGVNIAQSAMVSAGCVVLVYAIYLIATYLVSRSIVKNAIKRNSAKRS